MSNHRILALAVGVGTLGLLLVVGGVAAYVCTRPRKEKLGLRNRSTPSMLRALIAGLGVGGIVPLCGAITGICWALHTEWLQVGPAAPFGVHTTRESAAATATPMGAAPATADLGPETASTSTPSAPAPLLSSSPRSYLPSQSEMPRDYTLEPHMSPSLSPEQASVGYTNMANALSPYGDAIGVQFTVFVLQSEEAAHLLFQNIASDEQLIQDLANGVSPRLRPADAEFLHSVGGHEFAVFAVHGRDEQLGTIAVALYMVRVNNAVSVVCSWGNGQDKDSPRGLLEETLFHLSLVTDRMLAELPASALPLAEIPRPTSAPGPSPVPERTPAPPGHTVQVLDPNFPVETAVTVLEVRSGEAARSLFEARCLDDLPEQQEVVAVRLRLDYLSGPPNEMKSFNFLHFGATYPDGSAPDPFGSYCWNDPDAEFGFESYPPGAGEGWLAWAIREGGQLPHLVYQYNLAGIVDSGLTLDPAILLLE